MTGEEYSRELFARNPPFDCEGMSYDEARAERPAMFKVFEEFCEERLRAERTT